MKKVFPILNLDCANCAAQLENALTHIKGVESVRINFMNSKLTLEASDDCFDDVLAAVIAKAAKEEPDALIVTDPAQAQQQAHHPHHHHNDDDCCCGHEHSHHHGSDEDDNDDCCEHEHHHEHDAECHCSHEHHHEHDAECHCSHDHHHEHDDKCCCEHDHSHEHHHHEHEEEHGHHHQPTAVHTHDHEHGSDEDDSKQMLIRIAVSIILLVAGILLKKSDIISAFLFFGAYFAAGYDVLRNAARNISRGKVFDENFLMTVASLGAMAMGDFSEGVAVMVLYQIGEWFQDRAVDKSRASITELMDIRPDYANLLKNGETVTVDPDEVRIGDEILVKPGEKVPLDGIVLKGSSSLNTVALTGESLPRDVAEGDQVISGCVNLHGLLTVKVTNTFGESTVSKILELVENSSDKKAQAEKFITRFARYYTPAVCAAALLLAVIPSLITGEWLHWIKQALTFLVISCPCALVISVPLTFFSGIGGASRKGILVKSASDLETLSKADVIAFDKTGTLTMGVFSVTAVHPENVTREKLIELAAMAESYSDHPISRSLQKAYGHEIDKHRVADAQEIAGRGLCTIVDGKKLLCGNRKLMADHGLNINEADEIGTIVHVALLEETETRYLGYIVISDEVKPTTAAAISELKSVGVNRLVMLTGDHKKVAERIAASLGLTEAHAELLPEDKVSHVEQMLSNDTTLVFVGDGINDAPVLRRADIGIAMGAMGSDAAIEAADVVLMDDDPQKLPLAIRIARKTMVIVRQNIIFALAVKAAIMLLGVFGVASMWLAVFADVGVAMLAILNAIRAMHIR